MPSSGADSTSVVDSVADSATTPKTGWVVDTITLAEYEAQLKAQAKPASDARPDPKAEAEADAYFDTFSPEEIDDATVVLLSQKGADAQGISTIETIPSPTADRESPSVADPSAQPDHLQQSIAQVQRFSDPTVDAMSHADPEDGLNEFQSKMVDSETNATAVEVHDAASSSTGTSLDDTVAKVVDTSSAQRTDWSYHDLSTPVLIAVSIGLPLLIMLLIWNFGKLVSWYSRRRDDRLYRQGFDSQQWSPSSAEEDGDDSSNEQSDSSPQNETSDQGVKKNMGFKKVVYPKPKVDRSSKLESSNELLESELRNAQDSLALVKANSQRRDSDLQTKLKELNDQLNTKKNTIAKLESNLRASEETVANLKGKESSRDAALESKVKQLEELLAEKTAAFSGLDSGLQTAQKELAAARAVATERGKELAALATAQDNKEKGRTKLLSEVERLKEELKTKTTDLAKLKSDLRISDRALTAGQAEAFQRAKELSVDLELLGEELSSKTAVVSKLEADLKRARKALDSQKEVEEELQTMHQSEVAALEQQLSARSDAVANLESDLLKLEQSHSAAHEKHESRENELQAKIELLEEILRKEEATSRDIEAEMSKLNESLEGQQSNESQRTTELESQLKEVEQVVEQLKLELSQEKAAVADHVEKLAVSKAKVTRIRKERNNAQVNRSNYMKIAKKLVHYKKLYLANEEKIKDLVERNTRMSELSCEYLKATDGMIEELGGQAKLVSELRQTMVQSKASVDSEETGLFEQSQEEDSLSLEADFESNSDDSALVTSDGKPDEALPDGDRINRPR